MSTSLRTEILISILYTIAASFTVLDLDK